MTSLVRGIRQKVGSKKVVFVSGNFNIIHPGHLRLFHFAADLGGYLVVGVTEDGTDGVSESQAMRLQVVRSISYVDEVVALKEPPEQFLQKLKPEYVVKGREYMQLQNPELPVVQSYGGNILFSSGEVRFSSIDHLRREYFAMDRGRIVKPADYPIRNGFRINDLAAILNKFTDLRVVVIGDLIIDEYINCEPLGMSREDPTLVVSPLESKRFVGGAGIVAAHARGLGALVRFFSVAGSDEVADFGRQELSKLDVDAEILNEVTRPTTLKQRYRALGKTLLRVNHLRQHAIETAQQEALVQAVESALIDADLLLFADFNYGCLPQQVVDRLTLFAKRRGIMIAADSQASSQMSDISRYKDMNLITPTEYEVRLALRDSEAGLIVVADRLQKACGAENVVITLGGEGMLLHAPKNGVYRTDRLPAFNSSPKDVSGAGDSFFACTSLALRAGADIWQAAYLGSLAAGCQVSRVGNTPLTAAELIMEINNTSNIQNEMGL